MLSFIAKVQKVISILMKQTCDSFLLEHLYEALHATVFKGKLCIKFFEIQKILYDRRCNILR